MESRNGVPETFGVESWASTCGTPVTFGLESWVFGRGNVMPETFGLKLLASAYLSGAPVSFGSELWAQILVLDF